MGEKIIVGPIDKGLRNDRTAFVIDNDSFPRLINAYQWRGRVKRKRGTSFLCRLTRFFNSLSTSYNSGSTTITLNGGGAGNLLTGFSLQANGNIVPGSVTITVGLNVYTDPAMDGTLSPSGTINYATGAITIAAEAGNMSSATFLYYPSLPVMGLEDFIRTDPSFPNTIAFDTKYSYNINNTIPFDNYDVSFYKNPPTGFYGGYIQKTNWTPTSWNGQDYQQFWTVNYQGALWATNGITIPFTGSNMGMQFKSITGVAIIGPGTPPASANLTITAHGLVVGDFVFINEVGGITGINFQTGYVTVVVDANTVTVVFPNATLGGAYTSGGIAQYLTNRSDITLDCIRFYDGDPTNGNATTPVLNGTRGWVNFMPPLSQSNFSIADLPAAQYYLVGARMIVPFKDRLLFIGPCVQTSTGSPIYLRDTIVYSQNGTPYYTASFTGDPSLATTVFTPILVPTNQTASAAAYFEDQTGFGGFIEAGTAEAINTVSTNEDVLILGFSRSQAKLVYSGNDIVPFNFFLINSEYGASSTFSAVNMDEGVLTSGSRGYVITNQNQSKRFDLEIPDQIFQLELLNNGQERVCSQRDFINEWAYFTYPSNQFSYKFPTQTLQYNYRDNSWGIFNECYTTYGLFRQSTGYTWATIGTVFPTWNDWDEPWNAGSTTVLQPQVIVGNQQGFVVFRDSGTSESKSLSIDNISFPTTITGVTQAASAVVTTANSFRVGQTVTITGVVGMTQLNGNTYTIIAATPTTITLNVDSTAFTPYVSDGVVTPTTMIYSPNHCLNVGDYIIIGGCLGTISSQVNGKIFSVDYPINVNGFTLNPTITSGTYLGEGVITRMYVPQIQTKQFPVSWGIARKTRLGPQQYLFTKTANSQITLQIFLSQNGADAYNSPEDDNLALVNSSILFTCPESTNIGLTPANINLQMVTGQQQSQIWHRKNISLLGDTVQIGFTLSDAQMRSTAMENQFAEIELHSFILDVNPSQVLA